MHVQLGLVDEGALHDNAVQHAMDEQPPASSAPPRSPVFLFFSSTGFPGAMGSPLIMFAGSTARYCSGKVLPAAGVQPRRSVLARHKCARTTAPRAST